MAQTEYQLSSLIFSQSSQILEFDTYIVGLNVKDLLVGSFMSEYPVSVKPNVSIKTAIGFMAEEGYATLIVMEEENPMPIGILTEKGILRHMVSEGKSINDSVKESFIQSFISVTPDTAVMEAAKLMITKKSRVLVFADGDKLVGTITTSDMLRAFRETDMSPSLDNVISTRIYHCPYDTSILDAAKLLNEKNIGSILVTRDSSFGIFTERDLVKTLAKDVDTSSKVGQYSSFPLITADRRVLANEAASVMAAKKIKRLGLIADGSLIGIVTARDIVDAFQMTSA